MANTIVTHPVQDNQIRKENHEYTVLGVSQVYVGQENAERQEILKDQETGLNYSRNAVEAVEIYNLSKQKHHCWFLLDLETGSRGWYPGAELHGSVFGTDIPIYEDKDETSAVVITLTESIVVMLDSLNIDDLKGLDWYKVKFGTSTGYIKSEYISNITYADQF